jgi:ribosomal protein L18E
MKKPGREGKIVVVVGTVTDDARVPKIPKMKASFNLYKEFVIMY